VTDRECVLSLSDDLSLFIYVHHLLLFDGFVGLDAKSVSKAPDRADVIAELERTVHAVVHAFTEVSTTTVEITKMATTAAVIPVATTATITAAPIIHIATTAASTTPIVHIKSSTSTAAPVVAASATPIITVHVTATATTPVVAAGPTAALRCFEQIVQRFRSFHCHDHD
jgi:hypothetical protein